MWGEGGFKRPLCRTCEVLPSRVTTSNFQTAGSRNPRAGALTTTHRLPEEPRVTQPSQPCSEILEIKAGRERIADTSSEKEYFDAGQLWGGLGGIERVVGGCEGRSSCWKAASASTGDKHVLPSSHNQRNFSRVWKQSDKNKRNGETEESYRNRKAGSLGVRSALLFITESDRYRRHLPCDGRATVQLMAAE